jgi:transposase-like protein
VNHGEEPACKYCLSGHTRRYGRTSGGSQRWFCGSCKHTFLGGDLLPRKRTDNDCIASALDMFFQGQSVAAIRRSLKAQFGFCPAGESIKRWMIESSRRLNEAAAGYHPRTGHTWFNLIQAIEAAGKHLVVYDVVDFRTNYLLASLLSERPSPAALRKVVKQATETALKNPMVIVTDQFHPNASVINENFNARTNWIHWRNSRSAPENVFLSSFHLARSARRRMLGRLRSGEHYGLLVAAWAQWYNHLSPGILLSGRRPGELAGIRFPHPDWASLLRSPSS